MSEPEAGVSTEHVRYIEPGRSYVSSALLLGAVAVGFALDLSFGGGVSHLVGWLLAAFFIAGTDALGVYAARVMRTITITDSAVRVGEDEVVLDEIISTSLDVEPEAQLLGRRYTNNVPRNTTPIGLELTDDRYVVLATRNPDRVLELLGVDAVATEGVRPAEPDDLLVIPEIDERAESLFRVAGLELPEIEQSPEDLAAAKAVLVIGRPPIGYVQVDECDGLAYLHELAVLPGHMRKGHGTALIEAACDWAREHGYSAITLTTYADVAWNAPYYRKRGFVELTELTPGLAAVREREAALGLDAVGARVAMRRDL